MYAIFYDFYAFIYKTTFFSVHIPIISDSYTISWLRCARHRARSRMKSFSLLLLYIYIVYIHFLLRKINLHI